MLAAVCLLSGCHAAPAQPTAETAIIPETQTSETTQQTTAPPATTVATIPETTAATTQPETTAPETTEEILPEPGFDAHALVSTLSTQEKVGQIFLARCPDVDAVADIQTYHLGGYILFDREFRDRTPDELRTLTAEFQQASSIPMLIAVDEEGGDVTRVSCYNQFRESNFPSPRELYSQGGMALITETEQEKCRLLLDLGINVNMAPVCDITTDPEAFMYSRSLGQPPYTTAYFTKTLVEIMAENQIGSVLKHFPGYGNNSDTHTGIATDSRPLEELEAADLLPFSVGIHTDCGAVLMSHTFVTALDEAYPASLSPIVHNYLRDTMGFHGVIVTDDLVMQAITDLYGAEEAAVLAVLAGNDLLCSSEYQVQYAAVLNAVETGRIPADLLDQAVARVLEWKHQLGLIQ